jgi:predicted metal-dependent hydrolase
MPSIQFGTTEILFTLTHKELKRVAITVNEDTSVSIVAPIDAPLDKVYAVVLKKAAWILEKQELVRERVGPTSAKEWVSGEGLTYLGRTYSLKLQGDSVTMKNGKLYAPAQQTEETVLDWYRARALKKYEERVKLWSAKLPIQPTGVILGNQKGRWGSCDKHGVVRVNWRAIIAPLRIVDYIIVHELSHLKHPDHSSKFWKLVRSVMPDYEVRKEWLRINGATLQL